MKHAIIPLFITCLVVLTSMSDCEKNNIFYRTDDNYVSATIDGTIFESKPEKHPNSYPYYPHELVIYDSEFFFGTYRDLWAEKHTCSLFLNAECKESFELNKRYPLISLNNDTPYNLSSYVEISRDEEFTLYNAISGWVEFTSWDNKKYLSGRFEMDCVNEDNEIIEVRDGIFGPLFIMH